MTNKIYTTNLASKKHLQYLLKKMTLFVLFSISLSLFAQNPLLLKIPFAGAPGRSIQKIVATSAGNTFFNTVDNNNHFSNLWGLWVTDGTQAGTTKLSLTYPGFTTTEATLLTPLGNDKIVFAGDNEQGYGEIWATDGTQAGTIALERFLSGQSGPPITNIAPLGSIDVYSAITDNNHLQLRKTDGTATGTAIVYDFGLSTAASVAYFKTIGNIVYFELNNTSTTHNEIWRTDGTGAGTYQVKDLGQNYGFASDFMEFGTNIYFITISSTFGDYIWKSNGTNAGTSPLKQLSTSANNFFPPYAATSAALYFNAFNGIDNGLWKTDGTAGGTLEVAVTDPASNPAIHGRFVALNDVVYFNALTSVTGVELFKYDANSGLGATLVKDIFPGVSSSSPIYPIVQNNTILFSAANATEGKELWITDGTTANTIELADINPGSFLSSSPSLFSANTDAAYFAGDFNTNGDGITNDPGIYKYTAPQKIWTGKVSGDVSNANNWFPSGAPTSTDNIVLSVNPANSISNPFLFCKDLINNGTAINVGTGLTLMSGDFYNAGTINNNNGGVFGVAGGVANAFHSIGGPGVFTGQLTLSSGIKGGLSSNFYVNQLRVEGTNDSIYLGQYNLQVDAFNLYLPKIITDSTGKFIMPVGASPVTFPVAADKLSYSPVIISNSGTPDYFSVNVKNGVYSNGTSGNILSQNVVNKTWFIDEALSGGSNANITLQWNAADELPGFNGTNVFLNHFISGAWDAGNPGMASGAGPFTFSRINITSFSPFSISSSLIVLPVHLISFSASKLNSGVKLNWQTTAEINSSSYGIERSLDGSRFSEIGNMPAMANNTSTTTNYSFIDRQALQGNDFYRLKIIDIDGRFIYSKVVAIKMDEKLNTMLVFPNPVKDILNVQLTDKNETAVLQIIDVSGRKLKEQNVMLNENTAVTVDVHTLQKGTYYLVLKGKTINEKNKFVKE